MKKFVLTLIMLTFCSGLLAQYNGTPVTLKNVYKDDSEDSEHVTSRIHVRIKTTLQYDGMTPYVLESMAYSKVTMKAYGDDDTDYTARAQIQGTARGSNMPEIPPYNRVIYSVNMDAYAGRQQHNVANNASLTTGRSYRRLEVRARTTCRDYLPGWWDFEDMEDFARDLHDPWAWAEAVSPSSPEFVEGARADTDDPDAHDDLN